MLLVLVLLEELLLLRDGISTFTVDPGGMVRIRRLVTTYQVSPNGADDISYLDLTTILTLGYLRYDWRNLVARKYPRHKLAIDGTAFGAGQGGASGLGVAVFIGEAHHNHAREFIFIRAAAVA